MFLLMQRKLLGIKKLIKQNCEICGPDKKLQRAAFGPRAVYCACLIKTNNMLQVNTNLTVGESITVPSTSSQTGLELAIDDVNKYFFMSDLI
jgi:hypothetical protein